MFVSSCLLSLQLDSTVCREMSVSDTEASDVTWTDNGTFNLSEGHTPQTENSEGVCVCVLRPINTQYHPCPHGGALERTVVAEVRR